MAKTSIYNMSFDFTGEEGKLYPSKFEEPREEYRFVREAQAENYQIRSPGQVAGYFSEYVYTPFEQFTQEELWVLMVNTQNVVLYDALVYRGTIDRVQIRIAEIFRPAIYYNAAYIAIGHQHPSGNPMPSPEDVKVTERIVTAGKLLGVNCLDHVILGKDSYTSLREKHLGGFD